MTQADKKQDLRIKKTYLSLHAAMLVLLTQQNFNEITVNSLCAKALISRTTFYAHFQDKYDLFRCFLQEIQKEIIRDVNNYAELEKNVNGFIAANKKAIANIIKDANSETLMLVREFMASILDLAILQHGPNTKSPQHTILLNFAIGGLTNVLAWIVENDFPPGMDMMNQYLYQMLEVMVIWDAHRKQAGGASEESVEQQDGGI